MIQVFLLPYCRLEYFYKIGAVINFKENGIKEKENRLTIEMSGSSGYTYGIVPGIDKKNPCMK